jgi:hypothetical protein
VPPHAGAGATPGLGGGGGGPPGAAHGPWPGLAGAGWSQAGALPGGATTVGATGLAACAPAGGAQVVAMPAG